MNKIDLNLKNLFLNHPKSYNETYSIHFKIAIKIGIKLILAGMACVIHSIFPFIFKTTASDTVRDINNLMQERAKK